MSFSISIPAFSKNHGLNHHSFRLGGWGLAVGLLLNYLACCDSSLAMGPNPSATSSLHASYSIPTAQRVPGQDTSSVQVGQYRLRLLSQVSDSNLSEQEQRQQEELERQLVLEIERQIEIERQVQQELVDFTSSPNSSDVIVLGQPQNFPYVVVIPGDTFELLRDVQEVAPTAFMTTSRRGRYIHTASFEERRPADALSSQLRYLGFDAQVTYMPTN